MGLDNRREFEIHLKKKVINDPVLGKLIYEEYDSCMLYVICCKFYVVSCKL
jgi:hypothetical protein